MYYHTFAFIELLFLSISLSFSLYLSFFLFILIFLLYYSNDSTQIDTTHTHTQQTHLKTLQIKKNVFNSLKDTNSFQFQLSTINSNSVMYERANHITHTFIHVQYAHTNTIYSVFFLCLFAVFYVSFLFLLLLCRRRFRRRRLCRLIYKYFLNFIYINIITLLLTYIHIIYLCFLVSIYQLKWSLYVFELKFVCVQTVHFLFSIIQNFFNTLNKQQHNKN